MTGTHILVVDDEPQFLRAPQTNLRAAGYDVATAMTAEEALAPPAYDRRRRHPRPPSPGRPRYRRLPGAAPLDPGADHRRLGGRRGGREDRGARRRRGRLRDEAVRHRRAPGAAARRAPPGRTCDGTGARDRGARRRPQEALRHDGGAKIHLTPHEFELLRLLAQNEGKLLTHKTILREVWGPAYQRESSYIHVFVSQLRRKLEPEPARPRYIITEPGAGYRLVDPESNAQKTLRAEPRTLRHPSDRSSYRRVDGLARRSIDSLAGPSHVGRPAHRTRGARARPTWAARSSPSGRRGARDAAEPTAAARLARAGARLDEEPPRSRACSAHPRTRRSPRYLPSASPLNRVAVRAESQTLVALAGRLAELDRPVAARGIVCSSGCSRTRPVRSTTPSARQTLGGYLARARHALEES